MFKICQKWFGLHFGRFLSNSSGHPGASPQNETHPVLPIGIGNFQSPCYIK
jgi:hypothetical protein